VPVHGIVGMLEKIGTLFMDQAVCFFSFQLQPSGSQPVRPSR
jgi:hypothetical protein